MKTIEFSLRGSDPAQNMIKAMIDGIANQTGDHTLKMVEKK